eukprot:5635699-Pyramimonas_sp.AAC.1
MARLGRLSPGVHIVPQYFIKKFFRIGSVVSVRLAQCVQKSPPAAYADACALAHCDNDANP